MKIKISRTENPNCPPAQLQPNSCQRILVVENDADLRRCNSEALTCSGYQVDAAEDGAAAWGALQTNSYDLLITTQHMPRVSGVELLKMMHATDMNLPVIMATKFLPTWEFALHPWLQSATMLLKPYPFENLLGKVKNVLPEIAGIREEPALLPDWQSQPSAMGLQP